ncbi:MAG TPA: DUF2845 domain-containing protein [Steroidobacteraceae bacterium]|nr:DUF2845 domain-containing protein [Steroidobacteraceae bacterium]
MNPRVLLLAAAAALAAGGPARAENFRCGDRLVYEGDSAETVRARCGPPTEIRQQRTRVPPVIWRNGRPLRLPGGDREVVVDIWIYNLGPDRLMRRLRLEDGVVVEITTLGYCHR